LKFPPAHSLNFFKHQIIEMKFSSIFLASLAIITSGSANIELECKYNELISRGYYCEVQNAILISSKDDREIFEVRGQHMSGKNNDDVKTFYCKDKKVNFFPRNITKFFPNIATIFINWADLQEIQKEDLKPFGRKLKNLWLGSNKIRVIEGDLFYFSPNLERIDLSRNKIIHIDSRAFDVLEKLHSLWVNTNPCTSNDNQAWYNHSKVLQIIGDVEKCKDPNRFLMKILPSEEKIEKVSTQISKLMLEISNFATKLTETIEELEKNVKTSIEELKNLNSKIEENLSQKISKIESKVSALESKIIDNYERTSLFGPKLDQHKSEMTTLVSKLTEKCENDKNELKNFIKTENFKNFNETWKIYTTFDQKISKINEKSFEDQKTSLNIQGKKRSD
jgi:hypothetical protein